MFHNKSFHSCTDSSLDHSNSSFESSFESNECECRFTNTADLIHWPLLRLLPRDNPLVNPLTGIGSFAIYSQGKVALVWKPEEKRISLWIDFGENSGLQLCYDKLILKEPNEQPCQFVQSGKDGNPFAILLTTGGHLWGWGNNRSGQLGTGRGRSKPQYRYPTHLRIHQVHKVSVGENHVAAMTSDGRLITWGRNTHGQLGSGDLRDRSQPGEVNVGVQYEVVDVSCGENCTVALVIPRDPRPAHQKQLKKRTPLLGLKSPKSSHLVTVVQIYGRLAPVPWAHASKRMHNGLCKDKATSMRRRILSPGDEFGPVASVAVLKGTVVLLGQNGQLQSVHAIGTDDSTYQTTFLSTPEPISYLCPSPDSRDLLVLQGLSGGFYLLRPPNLVWRSAIRCVADCYALYGSSDDSPGLVALSHHIRGDQKDGEEKEQEEECFQNPAQTVAKIVLNGDQYTTRTLYISTIPSINRLKRLDLSHYPSCLTYLGSIHLNHHQLTSMATFPELALQLLNLSHLIKLDDTFKRELVKEIRQIFGDLHVKNELVFYLTGHRDTIGKLYVRFCPPKLVPTLTLWELCLRKLAQLFAPFEQDHF